MAKKLMSLVLGPFFVNYLRFPSRYSLFFDFKIHKLQRNSTSIHEFPPTGSLPIQSLIKRCRQEDPNSRPTFQDIILELESICEQQIPFFERSWMIACQTGQIDIVKK